MLAPAPVIRGLSRFFGRLNRTASPRERGFVGFWGGFVALSDNFFLRKKLEIDEIPIDF